MQPEKVEYEQALRVIGRHLDAEPAYHISVMEVPDGFAVRAHPSNQQAEGRTIHFGWDRVRDLAIFQTAGRGLRRRKPRHSGMWANFPNGHEDFFRALGHTLDVEHASSLSIDEVAEGIDITYMRPGADGVKNEKTHLLMRQDDVLALLRDAQSRRGTTSASSTA